ncbi:MAG: alanine racemase, partial [Desulfatiglandales bacterium]
TEPAMTLKGEVLQIRYLPSDSPVSYCRTYRTTCPLKVAIVSVGYADGIHRGVSNRGYCLINGEEAPIIGYVCMNMTICNVEHIENVKRGDEVVFLGRQGEKTLRAELVAEWSGTIPYEILCSVGSRNERYYKG